MTNAKTTLGAKQNYFFKTGKEEQTLYFCDFPDSISDRLHYLFFDPRYGIFDELRGRYHIVPLAELCREPIVRGQQPDYDEFGSVTVIKTVDLKNGYIDYDNALRVSQEFFEAHPAAHVHKDDILVASTGYVSMGKVDVYDRDEPAIVDGHVSIVRVKDGYDPHFVAYFLRSHLGQLQFEKWFTGSSGQIELQPTDMGRFVIPISGTKGIPFDKQQSIAAALRMQTNDAYVSEQQATELRRSAGNILFAELGIALPEEQQIDYFCCDSNRIGNRLSFGVYHPSVAKLTQALEQARYPVANLGNLIELSFDTVDPSNFPDKEFPYVGLEHVTPHKGEPDTIPIVPGSEIRSKSSVFKRGDLMFGGLRPYLNKAFILQDYHEAIGSSEWFVCRRKGNVSLRFLKFYMLSEAVCGKRNGFFRGQVTRALMRKTS